MPANGDLRQHLEFDSKLDPSFVPWWEEIYMKVFTSGCNNIYV